MINGAKEDIEKEVQKILQSAQKNNPRINVTGALLYSGGWFCQVIEGDYEVLDELFETITLIQTNKITAVPVILYGSDYWGGLKDWIQKTLLDKFGNISPDDMDLIPLVDDTESVIKIINDWYGTAENRLEPNYSL
jgi:hypothetical protein